EKAADWPPYACKDLDGPAHHQFLDLSDCAGRIQPFRADVHAIHDRVAAEQPVRIFQVVQALTGCMIPAVGNETIRLQQSCRADELVRIPPEGWAGRRTAGA